MIGDRCFDESMSAGPQCSMGRAGRSIWTHMKPKLVPSCVNL